VSAAAAPGRTRLGEAIRYGAASGLSAVITLGLPVVLHELAGLDPRLAVAIAFAVVFVVNFLTTRYLVFRDKGSVARSLPRFLASSLAFRGGEYLGFLGLYHAGLAYWLAQILVVGASFVLKFFTLRRFVFQR